MRIYIYRNYPYPNLRTPTVPLLKIIIRNKHKKSIERETLQKQWRGTKWRVITKRWTKEKRKGAQLRAGKDGVSGCQPAHGVTVISEFRVPQRRNFVFKK